MLHTPQFVSLSAHISLDLPPEALQRHRAVACTDRLEVRREPATIVEVVVIIMGRWCVRGAEEWTEGGHRGEAPCALRVGGVECGRDIFFFFKQKTAYEM